MATAIATMESAPAAAPLYPQALKSRLARFSAVPEDHDVATVSGIVVIFDRSSNTLEAGAVYVLEHQQPAAGMTWDIFHRIRSDRINTTREIVRVEPSSRHSGYWRRERAGAEWNAVNDVEEFALASKIVGKVVGIYAPGETGGSA